MIFLASHSVRRHVAALLLHFFCKSRTSTALLRANKSARCLQCYRPWCFRLACNGHPSIPSPTVPKFPNPQPPTYTHAFFFHLSAPTQILLLIRKASCGKSPFSSLLPHAPTLRYVYALRTQLHACLMVTSYLELVGSFLCPPMSNVKGLI